MVDEERMINDDQTVEVDHIELYGDPGIASRDAPVPLWLKITYVVVPLVSLVSLILYWNGSWGWLDRGYWNQLQKAANTTFPEIVESKFQYPDDKVPEINET